MSVLFSSGIHLPRNIKSSSSSSAYPTTWGRHSMFSSSILFYHLSSPCSLFLFLSFTSKYKIWSIFFADYPRIQLQAVSWLVASGGRGSEVRAGDYRPESAGACAARCTSCSTWSCIRVLFAFGLLVRGGDSHLT
jgi:hypothetical protein